MVCSFLIKSKANFLKKKAAAFLGFLARILVAAYFFYYFFILLIIRNATVTVRKLVRSLYANWYGHCTQIGTVTVRKLVRSLYANWYGHCTQIGTVTKNGQYRVPCIRNTILPIIWLIIGSYCFLIIHDTKIRRNLAAAKLFRTFFLKKNKQKILSYYYIAVSLWHTS